MISFLVVVCDHEAASGLSSQSITSARPVRAIPPVYQLCLKFPAVPVALLPYVCLSTWAQKVRPQNAENGLPTRVSSMVHISEWCPLTQCFVPTSVGEHLNAFHWLSMSVPCLTRTMFQAKKTCWRYDHTKGSNDIMTHSKGLGTDKRQWKLSLTFRDMANWQGSLWPTQCGVPLLFVSSNARAIARVHGKRQRILTSDTVSYFFFHLCCVM